MRFLDVKTLPIFSKVSRVTDSHTEKHYPKRSVPETAFMFVQERAGSVFVLTAEVD
jgi:hypothetical protein